MVIYIPNHHVEHVLEKLTPSATDTPGQSAAAEHLRRVMETEKRNAPYQMWLRDQASNRG